MSSVASLLVLWLLLQASPSLRSQSQAFSTSTSDADAEYCSKVRVLLVSLARPSRGERGSGQRETVNCKQEDHLMAQPDVSSAEAVMESQGESQPAESMDTSDVSGAVEGGGGEDIGDEERERDEKHTMELGEEREGGGGEGRGVEVKAKETETAGVDMKDEENEEEGDEGGKGEEGDEGSKGEEGEEGGVGEEGDEGGKVEEGEGGAEVKAKEAESAGVDVKEEKKGEKGEEGKEGEGGGVEEGKAEVTAKETTGVDVMEEEKKEETEEAGDEGGKGEEGEEGEAEVTAKETTRVDVMEEEKKEETEEAGDEGGKGEEGEAEVKAKKTTRVDVMEEEKKEETEEEGDEGGMGEEGEEGEAEVKAKETTRVDEEKGDEGEEGGKGGSRESEGRMEVDPEGGYEGEKGEGDSGEGGGGGHGGEGDGSGKRLGKRGGAEAGRDIKKQQTGKKQAKGGVMGKVKKFIPKAFRRSKGGDQAATKKARETEEAPQELPIFPTTLKEFKYTFNEEGQLRHTETGEPFDFAVKEGDQRYNQAHYEALGEVITEHVYELLETKGKLKRTTVPVDAKSDEEPVSFVFESEDARSNKEKLMVLIHGSGVVRAGQWARRLIINDCLESGTQLPFIHRAREEGYGILVLNTNRNHDTVNGREMPIRGNSSPEEHATYVWKHIVEDCAAREIYVVAHSYGGVVTTHLAEVRDRFKERVKKIAFTDSVHNFELQVTSRFVQRWMTEKSRNWVSCDKDLDVPVPSGGVPRVSAGTRKHEETSHFAKDSIFKYFTDDK